MEVGAWESSRRFELREQKVLEEVELESCDALITERMGDPWIGEEELHDGSDSCMNLKSLLCKSSFDEAITSLRGRVADGGDWILDVGGGSSGGFRG